jgi:hypothetical protein
VACRRYPFRLGYSTEDYLAILATQSSTHALGRDRGAEFLARVRHRLEALGSPQLTATFVGTLTVGRVLGDHVSAATSSISGPEVPGGRC